MTRRRLLDRLDAGLDDRLTLVSAPAGFGKTTLVADWLDARGRARKLGAWLSLDEADGDLRRFLRYLIAALRTAEPTIGAEALTMTETSHRPEHEPVLTALLNEFDDNADGEPVVLVLDDFHAIDSRPVDAAVTFLIEHAPRRLHVVITTREDPRLPLARLRAKGQLTELRASDLRFTSEEAAAFLNGSMGLTLTVSDVARLEARTEGWIAGLQLAALSLHGRDDVATFLETFTGSHRYVLDYLVEEVLERQPDEVRSFLLRTSILTRLTGPLCDAVLASDADAAGDGTPGGSVTRAGVVSAGVVSAGGAGASVAGASVAGATMLAALERSNLFVIALDDQRRWYRYHHLFADVLQAYAASESGDELPVLHRRASVWYEQQGMVTDAVRHALAAADTERAADLVEASAFDMRRTRQGGTLLAWIEALPTAEVERRPMLSLALAATQLDSGQLEDVARHLDAAARSTSGATDPLMGSITMHRAGLALVAGDTAAALHHARYALEIAQADDLSARGGALGLVGLAHWSAGELEEAHASFAAGMEALRAAGFVADAIGGVATLAEIRLAQGRLRGAVTELEHALELAAEEEDADPRGALDLHVTLSELLRERNDLDGAEQHQSTAEALGDGMGWAHSRSRWLVARALLDGARGDHDAAALNLERARRSHQHGFFPDVRPIAAMSARVALAAGRLDEALAWAGAHARHHSAAGTDVLYLREYEDVTMARVLLASFDRYRREADVNQAHGLLTRLAQGARDGGRGRSLIEVLVLRSVTATARGDLQGALPPLAEALTLAEPEGFVRVFLDEGRALAESLRRVEEGLSSPAVARFCRSLLEAGTAAPGQPAPDWLEPLTDREREVLDLIAQGLSNGAIAKRLFRAESTIKGQNRVIFEKLQVKSRTEAIARARELGIL